MSRKFFISLILFIFLTLSVVSANENGTGVELSDDSVEGDVLQVDESDVSVEADDGNGVGSEYNSKIIAKDVSLTYDQYDKEFSVQLKDSDGVMAYAENFVINWDGKHEEYSLYDLNNRYYFDAAGKSVGNHKVTLSVADSYYSASPVIINIKITKAPVKLVAKKLTSTTNKYTTLKVQVYDKNLFEVNEGTVKFKINGKSYKAKVKDGVAVKKIMLKKPKDYIYKAIFSSKNYKTKSISSKVQVKKIKLHSVKIGKYKGVLSSKQYAYLKKVSKNNKWGHVDLKSSNFKGYTIAINHYTAHFSKQNCRYYEKGFYASVYKTNMGKDGMKIYSKRIYI